MTIIASCFAAIPAAAGTRTDVWNELLASRPLEAGVPLSNIVLVRDAFTLYLKSGAFFPLTEVSGRVVGGVFRGEGRFELRPASDGERSFLERRTGLKRLQVLTDEFREAVLLFTDGTGKEILSSQPSVHADQRGLASIYDVALGKADKELHADLRLRLMPDLIEGAAPTEGLFLICFDGHKLSHSIAVFSPRGLVRTWLKTDSGPETTALLVYGGKGGLWYSERPLATVASAPAPPAADLVALHYSVETTIHENMDIEGRTTIRLRAACGGVRVIPIQLFAKLRLSSVRLKKGDGPALDVPFIQGDKESSDPVMAVLPQPLAPGEEAELSAEYRGEGVLHAAGGINFYVDARENWYPALNGSRDWAVHDLEYRIPKKRHGNLALKWAEGDFVSVLSSGRLADSVEDGDFAVYRFATERPVRRAGFIYGKFQLIEHDDPDSGIKIRLYSIPGLLDVEWGFIHYDSMPMAKDVSADSLNTARVGSLYFGPLLQNDITVTERLDSITGQSWPMLVHVPYVAFLDWVTHSGRLVAEKQFAEGVTPRGFAHQWWGHTVGAATYRDIWLEEGLAEFTVGLVVEKALGERAAFTFWERTRKDVLGISWHPHRDTWKTGPIRLGSRLMIGGGPGAPSDQQTIICKKGAYVVHMLRKLLWEPDDPSPDRGFIDTMKDFAKTWAGRNATTADFQAIVERHAPKAVGGNMGWFFRQWIEGTAIPKIKAAVRIEDAGSGSYRLTGEITQSEVPEDFRSILPVYLEIEKGRFERCAQVSVTGNRTLAVRQKISLPKKPLRVLVNPNQEWLTR